MLVGLSAVLGEDDDAQLRARRLFDAARDGTIVDPELLAVATSVVASTGTVEDYEHFVERFRHGATPQEQLRHLYALAEFGDEALMQRTCDFAFSGEVKTQNAPFLLGRCIANRDHGTLAWRRVRERWADAMATFPSNTIVRMVDGVKLLNRPEQEADVQGFFAEHDIPQSAKTLQQVLERQRVNVALASQGGSTSGFGHRAPARHVTPRPAVFGVGTEEAQLVWSRVPAGEHTVLVGDRSWTVVGDGVTTHGAIVHGLQPGTDHDVVVDGRRRRTLRTLTRPSGRLLARVATISDLHVGELAFGHLPRLRSQPTGGDAAAAHPMWGLRAAIDEIIDWAPDLLVVKGDLGHYNRPSEYDLLAPELLRAGVPLMVTGGNHDGGNQHRCNAALELARLGIEVTDPVQVRDVNGALVVLGDTVIEGEHGGTTMRSQPAIIDALSDHAGPCLVALHHQLMTTRIPYYLPVGIPKAEASAFLDAVEATRPGAVVTSGHTHRNRARRHGSLLVTEVGAPKDYPAVWAAYELYEGGVVQTVRRILEPRTLAWSERCRGTVATMWGRWSPGRLADRCITHTG